MTTRQPDNQIGRGIDVSNLGDYSNMIIKTKDGEERNIHLYGR